MVREKAEQQKQKAKEMLGISDERAKEIFEEQPDRKQQKKKELEQEGTLDTTDTETETVEEPEPADEAEEQEETEDEVEIHECPECGDEFDSSRGMNVHKSQKH